MWKRMNPFLSFSLRLCDISYLLANKNQIFTLRWCHTRLLACCKRNTSNILLLIIPPSDPLFTFPNERSNCNRPMLCYSPKITSNAWKHLQILSAMKWINILLDTPLYFHGFTADNIASHRNVCYNHEILWELGKITKKFTVTQCAQK